MDQEKQYELLKMFGELEQERAKTGSIDLESKRNYRNVDVYERMLRLSFPNLRYVAAGHHIMFMWDDQPIPKEISSADTIIFDHAVAKIVWGDDYKEVLAKFAAEPQEERDELVRKTFFERHPDR